MMARFVAVGQLWARCVVGAVAVMSAASCGGEPDVAADPARAFVETPGARVLLRNGVFLPRGAVSALQASDDSFVIAKFDGRVPIEARRTLAAAGHREVTYLPYDALLLEASACRFARCCARRYRIFALHAGGSHRPRAEI